jgi:hypothetical protein
MIMERYAKGNYRGKFVKLSLHFYEETVENDEKYPSD